MVAQTRQGSTLHCAVRERVLDDPVLQLRFAKLPPQLLILLDVQALEADDDRVAGRTPFLLKSVDLLLLLVSGLHISSFRPPERPDRATIRGPWSRRYLPS